MTEETFVQTFTFRPYTGTRKGRLWRLFSVSWFNMTYQWARSRWLKILIGFIVFTFIMQNMFVIFLVDMLSADQTPNQILETQLWNFVRGIVQWNTVITSEGDTGDANVSMSIGGTSIMILICVVLMGSGLISDDMRYKATEVYYSRLSKTEYIIGKYGAFFLFGNLFFTLPYVLEFFLLVMGIGNIDLIAAIPLLLQVIIFTEAVTLVYGSIIIAFSSITSKRLYAGMTMFMMVFVLGILIQAFTMDMTEFTPLIYFDIFTLLLVFSFMLAGDTSIQFLNMNFEYVSIDLSGQAGFLVIPFILLYIVLGLLILVFQILWRQPNQ